MKGFCFIPFLSGFQDASAQQETSAKSTSGLAEGAMNAGRELEDNLCKDCSTFYCQGVDAWLLV